MAALGKETEYPFNNAMDRGSGGEVPQADREVAPDVVVSLRGPAVWKPRADGKLVPTLGPGGLVSALTPVVGETTWVAGAPDAQIFDRHGPLVRCSLPPAGTYSIHYVSLPGSVDRMSARFADVLWRLLHRLARGEEPTGESFTAARAMQQLLASAAIEALARIPDPVVWVHDYNLMLVPRMIKRARPDARVAAFIHTPCQKADAWRVIPDRILAELWDGLLGADLVGWNARRWAENFISAAASLLEVPVDEHHVGTVRVGSYPLGVDAESLRRRAAAATRFIPALGIEPGSFILTGIDRSDPSKQVPARIRAFGRLLNDPWYRGRVQMIIQVVPTRQHLAAYRDELDAIRTAEASVNRDYGAPRWTPVRVLLAHDRELALALSQVGDGLVVSAHCDGQNLVAFEFSAVNRRDGVLVLSTGTGAYEVLGRASIALDPDSEAAMARAMVTAVETGPSARALMAAQRRTIVNEFRPSEWLESQMRDLPTTRR